MTNNLLGSSDLTMSNLYCRPSPHYFTGFRIRIFFADPDPGKNFHADPGEGGGGKGKKQFFFSFFHVSDDS